MFCPNCGKEIIEDENINFCPECGEKIKDNIVSKNNIHCPKCNSSNFNIEKRGYNTGAIQFGCLAVILGFLTFGIAWIVLLFILLSGCFGADEPIWICKNCGHKWEEGKNQSQILEKLGFEKKEKVDAEKDVNQEKPLGDDCKGSFFNKNIYRN